MQKDKFLLVVFSGDLDKVLAAFILATTAASMGMETKMFFTFWGLNVLRKKKLTAGSNLLQRMMNFMNKGGAGRLPLSKFNMLGLGPFFMKKMMKESNEKWKNVNDKFMDAITNKQQRVYCWACDVEIEGEGLKHISWESVRDFDEIEDRAICRDCMNEYNEERNSKHKEGHYPDPEVEGVK